MVHTDAVIENVYVKYAVLTNKWLINVLLLK